MLTSTSFRLAPGATHDAFSAGLARLSPAQAIQTLPATGLRVETAMQVVAVLLAVGTTLLLIRRKRREMR